MTDHEPSERREFRTQIHIDAPREAVFKALTDAAQLSRWFAPENKFDPLEGGEVRWEWDGHYSWLQRIEILEPGARLRTRYESSVDDGEGGKKPLCIDFLFEGEGGVTTLRVVQSGFTGETGFDQESDGISHGWPIEMRSLQLYLERHAGQDRQLVWSRTCTDEDQEPVWKRLVSGDCLRCEPSITALSAGDRFDIRTAGGQQFGGTVVVAGEREFVGLVENFGGALLRLWASRYSGITHLWRWLARYGQPTELVSSLAQEFDKLLEQVCGTGTAATGEQGS